MQIKGDMFPEKRMKSIFVNVLDFMLNLDKMQNISTLMCKSSNILNTVYWVFWLSDWVVDCIQIDYI